MTKGEAPFWQQVSYQREYKPITMSQNNFEAIVFCSQDIIII